MMMIGCDAQAWITPIGTEITAEDALEGRISHGMTLTVNSVDFRQQYISSHYLYSHDIPATKLNSHGYLSFNAPAHVKPISQAELDILNEMWNTSFILEHNPHWLVLHDSLVVVTYHAEFMIFNNPIQSWITPFGTEIDVKDSFQGICSFEVMHDSRIAVYSSAHYGSKKRIDWLYLDSIEPPRRYLIDYFTMPPIVYVKPFTQSEIDIFNELKNSSITLANTPYWVVVNPELPDSPILIAYDNGKSPIFHEKGSST
jgi:hypothetical protein